MRDSISRGSTDAVLPGMILNTKKKVAYHDAWLGCEREVPAGRLECTMQNLADCLASASHEPLGGSSGASGLDTFVVYNQRRKVRGWRKEGVCLSAAVLGVSGGVLAAAAAHWLGLHGHLLTRGMMCLLSLQCRG